jgi:ABC-type multidrug transport system fused ATPase/permease subunit
MDKQIIFYFMAGISSDAEKFFTFFSVVLLTHIVAVSSATLAVGISRDFSKASVFVNLLFTLQSFGCGFFVQQDSMGVWIRWTKYISFVYWGLSALMSSEFSGASYPCPSGNDDDLVCSEYQGWFILESMGIQEYWVTLPMLVLVAFFGASYLLSAILLYFNKVDINVAPSRGKGNDSDRSAGKERMETRAPFTKTINVVLQDYKLDVLKFNFKHRKFQTLEILKGISADFEPGKLNVIMGPSGSGKVSDFSLPNTSSY